MTGVARALIASLPVLILATGLTATSPAALGQGASKVPVIAVFTFAFPSSSAPVEAFRQGLREQGYVDGKTVRLEFRSAEGRTDRLAPLAAELAAMKADVIVTEGSGTAIAMKKATDTVPIVSAVMVDPVALGLVPSLNRPGGNLTGLTLAVGAERGAKQLEFLKEIAPRAKQVAVIYNATIPSNDERVRIVEAAGRSLGLQLQFIPVSGPEDFDKAFETVGRSRSAAMITMGDGMLWANRKRIVAFANKSRLPAAFPEREFAEEGGLVAYGPSLGRNFRRAAVYVDKILKGAKPGELPIERPTQQDLVLNIRTAKALGVKIPQRLLVRADEVIQ